MAHPSFHPRPASGSLPVSPRSIKRPHTFYLQSESYASHKWHVSGGFRAWESAEQMTARGRKRSCALLRRGQVSPVHGTLEFAAKQSDASR